MPLLMPTSRKTSGFSFNAIITTLEEETVPLRFVSADNGRRRMQDFVNGGGRGQNRQGCSEALSVQRLHFVFLLDRKLAQFQQVHSFLVAL